MAEARQRHTKTKSQDMRRIDSSLKSSRPMAQNILTEGPVNSVTAKLEHTWASSDLETAPIMVCGCPPFSLLSVSLDVNHWRLHCESAETMAET